MLEPARELPTDELELYVERAQAGDAEALNEIYRRFREPLLARIRLMMGDAARRVAESGDYMQSAFAAALPALGHFEDRGDGSFLRWLTTIARNKIREDLRGRREQALSMLSSSLRGATAPERDRDGTLSFESALALVEALEQLSESERELIELRDFDGMSFVELGRRLGCSDRQAHRTHGRALLRLSRLLQP